MNFLLGGFFYLISWILIFVQCIGSDVKFKLRNWKLKIWLQKHSQCVQQFLSQESPGSTVVVKQPQSRLQKGSTSLPFASNTYSVFNSQDRKTEENLFKRRVSRPWKYFVGLQHWTGALVTSSPRSAVHLHHLIKILRWNRKLLYTTFFYSVNWWIFVLFKLSVMAGLLATLSSLIHTVYSVYFVYFLVQHCPSLEFQFSFPFGFHIIIIVTVQRKFFVYLLQILLQLVKWRVEIIYLTKKDSQNEKSIPKTTAKLIIATCIAFS